MKKLLLTILGISGLLFVTHSEAKPPQGDYFTNFDSYPKINGHFGSLSAWWAMGGGLYSGDYGATSTATPNLTFPNDWVTTDKNGIDYVGKIVGWSNPDISDWWASMGGQIGSPFTNHVELWRPLNQPYTGTDLLFNVTFGITTAGNGYNDSFGWNFRDTNLNDLFKIVFTPNLANPNTELDVWWKDAAGTMHDSSISIVRGGKYNLSVDVDFSAESFTATLSNGNTMSFSGSGIGSSSSIGAVAACWDLASSHTDADGNYDLAGTGQLLFNDYFVGIPEPSTVVLTLTGLGALAFWQRNRKRA